MRVALVHELLTMRGGAEQVLRIFAEMFPDAPIYTLLYDEKALGDWFPRERIRTSAVQKIADRLPFPGRYNHHLYLKKFPAAVEAWDFSEFDLVISSSSAFAHGIITNGEPKHLSYVHSPARYLWDRTHDVLERAGKGLFGPWKRRYLERAFHTLRIWDAEVADRPDAIISASKEVARRVSLYWRRESDVITPPISDFWFDSQPSPKASLPYFLIVSTLVSYKRIDLAIEASNLLKVPLKIAGQGPDAKRLKKLAGPTVEFLGYVPESEAKMLFAGAAATIFPGEEDFGLVPLESMACGTPVVAFRAGGALETVIDGKTGTFFSGPTAKSLAETLSHFRKEDFNPSDCISQAKNFSREKFESQIREAVEKLVGGSACHSLS